MPRLARVVVPGYPHHVIQRGNRRQKVFFHPSDRASYLQFLQAESSRHGVTYLAYCLMDNHVHFVAVPARADSLARAIGEAHRRYTSMINQREGWSGYLWQGRFISFPVAEQYLERVVQYVENNPVRAGLVSMAHEYGWSSAAARYGLREDRFLSRDFIFEREDEKSVIDSDVVMENLLAYHGSTGRPMGSNDFIVQIEKQLGRKLQKKKSGRKPIRLRSI